MPSLAKCRLGGINDAKTHGEQHHHCAEQTPALPLVADHAAESMGQSDTDQKNQPLECRL